jgi:CheY-like chemotaxis protein
VTRRRILVVDDDADTRFLLRLIFESADYDVWEAPHGVAALIHLKNELPDLVVVDMVMPQMSGAELIQRLRTTPRTEALLIVAVSGHPNATDTAKDANAVLSKPFDREELLALVGSLVASENPN